MTDANVVLHWLKPGARLAGRIALEEGLARRVLRTLGLEGLANEAAAEGVVRIAVARMVSAIKQISVAKGHDPRDFTLVAYGGAGPMHGAFIAEELEIERSSCRRGPATSRVSGRSSPMEAGLREDAHPASPASVVLRGDCGRVRAAGGGGRPEPRSGGSGTPRLLHPAGARHALSRPVLGDRRGYPPDMAGVEALEAALPRHPRTAFRASQRRRDRGGELPADGIGRGTKLAFGAWRVPGDGAGAGVETRPVFFGGRFFDTPVLARDRLPAEASHAGPAIVEEEGATTVVPPEWRFTVLDSGDLLVEKG